MRFQGHVCMRNKGNFFVDGIILFIYEVFFPVGIINFYICINSRQ